jgi:hypothetical protein
VSSLLSVSLFKFITWDKSQLVGLGIPLRFIAKPSYARHCTNPNVVHNSTGQFSAMNRLLNLLGLRPKKYPRMQYDIRGEEVAYVLPDKKLRVWWTHMDGQRTYTDSIDKWTGGIKLTSAEKRSVFADIVGYLRRQTKEKLIIVINTDHEKSLWESECKKFPTDIKAIEYTSDNNKGNFAYNMLLAEIPNLTVDGIKITSKEELDNYWLTKKN